MSVLVQCALFLGAAVVAVPLFRRLGLGAVLGYLAAGVAIGPWGLGLISDVEQILHFGELGVVLLLFVIGLELQPRRLWALRHAVFGLGGSQVAVSAALLALAGYALGLPAPAAAVTGLALSLSSTAFALQTLAERGELTTRYGRAAFGTLLFQDLAVIPVLALLPLVAAYAGGAGAAAEVPSVVDVLRVVGVVAAVILGGHYLLRHVLRVVAAAGTQEVFTALALLTVIGTALVMHEVGLSMALGAFLAGVLLADSEYRHALEADIEPFKGLLLGLFFMAVGMSVDVGLLAERPGLVLSLAAGLVAVKLGLIYALGRLHGLPASAALGLGLVISQGGEFAFVILGAAAREGLVEDALVDFLILAVTLSMASTPLMLALRDRLRARRRPSAPAYDRMPDEEAPVVIAGFGRFGQIIARILRAKKIPFTALEVNPEQVDFVRRLGNTIYYGDASRLELLRAANADKARVFVLAIDDVDASLATAQLVRRHFPHLTICARARNRKHAYRLMDLGIHIVRRETFLSSLDLAREVLEGLGLSRRESERAVETFRRHDERRLLAHHETHDDEEKMVYLAQKAAEELEELFEQDAAEAEGRARRR